MTLFLMVVNSVIGHQAVMSALINFSCFDNKFFGKSKLLTLKQNNSDFLTKTTQEQSANLKCILGKTLLHLISML